MSCRSPSPSPAGPDARLCADDRLVGGFKQSKTLLLFCEKKKKTWLVSQKLSRATLREAARENFCVSLKKTKMFVFFSGGARPSARREANKRPKVNDYIAHDVRDEFVMCGVCRSSKLVSHGGDRRNDRNLRFSSRETKNNDECFLSERKTPEARDRSARREKTKPPTTEVNDDIAHDVRDSFFVM